MPSPIGDKLREIGLGRYFPPVQWIRQYRRLDLVGDLSAGVIVAAVIVPQSMAYSLLAGLPPQVGLYASIVPLILYGLLGTSRTLSVGPVAIVSLLVASAVGRVAPASDAEYFTLVLLLTFMVGCLQLAMGLVRLGFLVNFLSHPVISGFTSAAAMVIVISQLRHLMGITPPDSADTYQALTGVLRHLGEVNLVTSSLALVSIIALLYSKVLMPRHLRYVPMPRWQREGVARLGPLVVVIALTLITWAAGLHHRFGVDVVGQVPAGLPSLSAPRLDLSMLNALLPAALTISFIGFVESIAVAKALAIRRRQRIEPNQELVALGVSNLGAAFSSGFPVAGGLSRSLVNFNAGANTGLASIITALLVGLTVLLLTPLLEPLPRLALAAIIVVGVVDLIDLTTLRRVWHYNKADGVALLITFGVALAVSMEVGIAIGIATSLLLYVRRTSRPQIAIVGRVGDSEQFRNISRFQVNTYPQILAVRVDESLYFANIQHLEDTLLRLVSDQPDVKHLILICSAINSIDASSLETLESLIDSFREGGVNFYLAEVKGPVLEQLRKVGFDARLGADRIFVSTHLAIRALSQGEQPQIRYETIMNRRDI